MRPRVTPAMVHPPASTGGSSGPTWRPAARRAPDLRAPAQPGDHRAPPASCPPPAGQADHRQGNSHQGASHRRARPRAGRLHLNLAAASRRSHTADAEPAAATGIALTAWARACENWLWKAAGNEGQLPAKFAGRCGPPTRQKIPWVQPGRDGMAPAPRTAVAGGVMRRLQEANRFLSVARDPSAARSATRQVLRAIQRITWRSPAPRELKRPGAQQPACTS